MSSNEYGRSKEYGVQRDEYANGNSLPPRRGGKFKRHCARFWWLHLILFILIALLVVLLLIFVGIPRIAQDGINKSGTVVTKQVYTNPSPDAVDLELDGQFLSSSSYKPALDPFQADLYLLGRDAPFTTLNFPAIPKAANGTAFSIKQRTPISNFQEVLLYTEALLGNKTLDIIVKGRGGLREMKLPKTTVNYNQRTTLTGLNGLSGIVVSNFRLGQNLPYNSTASGNATIPNPSVATITLGDVSLNMTVGGTFIGTSTLPGLVLTPGNNTYPLYSNVDQLAVAQVLSKPQYQCGVIQIDMKGNASIVDGQIIPYYTQAFQNNKQTVTLDLSETLKAAGLGTLIKGPCQT